MFRAIVSILGVVVLCLEVISSCGPAEENTLKTINVKLRKTGRMETNYLFWKQNLKRHLNCIGEGMCAVTPGETTSAQATVRKHQNYIETNLTFPVSRSLHGTRWSLWDPVDDIMLFDCNLTTYVRPTRPDCLFLNDKWLICWTEKVYPVLMCDIVYKSTHSIPLDRVHYYHTSYTNTVEYFRSECRVNVSEEIQSGVTTFHVNLYPKVTGEKSDSAYGSNITVALSHNTEGLQTWKIIAISTGLSAFCIIALIGVFKFKCIPFVCRINARSYFEENNYPTVWTKSKTNSDDEDIDAYIEVVDYNDHYEEIVGGLNETEDDVASYLDVIDHYDRPDNESTNSNITESYDGKTYVFYNSAYTTV